MRRLRQLAERTPASRDRYIDLLRAVAIVVVVLGHWSVTVIGYDRHGHPTGHSALPQLRWAYPLTWLAQVMPVFFLVGGYANAASLTARRRHGGTATDWLLDRSARLLRPTTVLVLVLATAALGSSAVGADTTRVREVTWFATLPLWFLSAYLVMVPLTPVTYALHRRYGLAVPAVLVALVALGDVGRLTGPQWLATGNYLFGWLAIHQVGFAWYERHSRPEPGTRPLPTGRGTALTLVVGGLTVLLLLTGPGPYPVNLLAVPGERWANASPPSLALLAAATMQLGLIMLVREPVTRWLRRCGPWQLVIAVNAVVLTVFLWHLSAAALVVGALDALHLLPTPRVATAAWWAWRVPWLAMLSLVLTVLVAVFGPVEARTSHPAPGHRRGAVAVRMGLAVAGFAAVVVGLLINSGTGKTVPVPTGLPVTALVCYLGGAGLLRLLRSGRSG